jgi:nucleoside-diphosphate-sugar epimerase
MHVLVTGCAGFIGSHLCEQLLSQGHEVAGVDCFTDYYPRSVKESNLERLRREARFTLHEVDLADADLSPLLDGVDVVYHQAAQPGVRGSWGNQFTAYVRNNVQVTQSLLEAALRSRHPPRKFVYASSSSIYGVAEQYPTNEALRPDPVSPYAVTKLAGEHLARLYWRNYGLPTIALRYFTVYGPRQRPDMAFHRFIRQALRNEPVQVFGTGEQTRDFTFVSDVVAANIAASQSDLVGIALNVGGGSRTSVNRAIELIGALLGRNVHVVYFPTEHGDVPDTSADTSSAQELLGFVPKVGLEHGLAAQIEWLASQAWSAEQELAQAVRGTAQVYAASR